MNCSAKMTSVHDNDIIIFEGKTIVCRSQSIQDLTVGQESASSSRPAQAETNIAACTTSTTGSDPQISARSITPIPISFDALSADPIPLKRCVLWNRRRVWSREEQHSERDSDAFG